MHPEWTNMGISRSTASDYSSSMPGESYESAYLPRTTIAVDGKNDNVGLQVWLVLGDKGSKNGFKLLAQALLTDAITRFLGSPRSVEMN